MATNRRDSKTQSNAERRPDAGLHRALVGQLVAMQELEGVLGGSDGPMSRKRVAELVNRPEFPEPVATLGVGRIWLKRDVLRWNRERLARQRKKVNAKAG